MEHVAKISMSDDSFLWLTTHDGVIDIVPWKNDVGHGRSTLDRKQAIALGMALIQWTDGVPSES